MAAQHPATITTPITTLLTILTNQLLLLSTAPYLSAHDIHTLTLTSRALYNSIHSSPSVHRHLDLSLAAVSPRSKNVLPRLLTTTPHHRILQATRTLILDNLPINITQLRAIMAPNDRTSNLQILSIRGCRGIVERELMALLPETSLKGVYWFSDPDAKPTGRFVKNARLRLGAEWVPVLKACEGRIVFDTVVCDGERHAHDLAPQIANVRLGGGCSGCGEVPRASKALVAPAPLFGGLKTACGDGAEGVLRCEACVKERWCECCGVWWCAECVQTGAGKVKRTCFECGSQCVECTTQHSRTCSSCTGGYCITHNEGADESYCEWCIAASVPRRGFAASNSNAFLTSPARSYYLSLGAPPPRSAAAAKPRTVSSGTPFRAATNVPIGGRQFQKEIAASRRVVGML